MKLIFKIFLIAFIGYFADVYFMFWGLATVAFIVNVIIKSKPFPSFLAGFIGAGLLWLSFAFYIDYKTNSIMSDKIAAIFQTSGDNLLLIIGLLGALIGGVAGYAGYSFYMLFEKKKKKYY